MSWIPSYNMLEDCPQYVRGVKMSVDITSGVEKLMTSGFVSMTVLSTEFRFSGNTMSI